MKEGMQMVAALRYKLWVFGVLIYVSDNILCYNKAIYKNTITPQSLLKKKHNCIAYHSSSEAVAAKTMRVANKATEKNLADLFTKIIIEARRRFLLDKFTY